MLSFQQQEEYDLVYADFHKNHNWLRVLCAVFIGWNWITGNKWSKSSVLCVNENINIHSVWRADFLCQVAPNQTLNVKSKGRNSFFPLSKVWLSLRLFSTNTQSLNNLLQTSYILRSTQNWQKCIITSYISLWLLLHHFPL